MLDTIDISNLINLGIAYLIAAMSPGPSLIAIFKNSLNTTKEAGVCTAIGIVVGIGIQSLYTIIGTQLLSDHPQILLYIQIACSCYLIYLGLRGFVTYFSKNSDSLKGIKSESLTKAEAFKQGLLIDVLNPVALSFFIVIFSLFIPQDASITFKVLCWTQMIIIGIIWFVGLAALLSSKIIKDFFIRFMGSWINPIASAMFILFGVKILFKF